MFSFVIMGASCNPGRKWCIVLRVLANLPEKIWSSISFLLLNIIDSNFGHLEISVYTLQKNKKILCISINIYLYTQLPVHPRDQSLFTYLNILILHRGEKRKLFYKLIKYICCCCIEVCFYKISRSNKGAIID